MTESITAELNQMDLLFFRENGFRVVEEDYRPESFGNSLVVFENGDIRVRFLRDRSQYFGEVASHTDPDDWWAIDFVLPLLPQHTGATKEGVDLENLRSVADRFIEHYPALVDLFRPDQYEDTRRVLRMAARERASIIEGHP